MDSAQKALAWMEGMRASTSGTWLFRGQRKVHPSVQSSLARLNEKSRVTMYNVCRRFHTAAAGVTGYSVEGSEDRLALLQHYIGLSPLIDLTGTPLIALYFALTGSAVGDECVVYALDTSFHAAGSSQCRIVDHSFLALPLFRGGLQHRWLRQDGYAACPNGWPSMEAVDNFDLLQLEGIREKRFVRRPNDFQMIAELGDLESVDDDPLAGRVRGVVDSVLRAFPSCPELEDRIAQSKTLNISGRLRKELQQLHEHALVLQAPQSVLRSVTSLKDAERMGYWDTSFECAFDSIKQVVAALDTSNN